MRPSSGHPRLTSNQKTTPLKKLNLETFVGAFLLPSRWPRGTVNMHSIELVAILVATSALKTCSWGPCEHPRSLQGAVNPCRLLRTNDRHPNIKTAYLQCILPPRCLLHSQYAIVRIVARDTVNMQTLRLASIYGAPSDDLASEHSFQTKKKSFST